MMCRSLLGAVIIGRTEMPITLCAKRVYVLARQARNTIEQQMGEYR